MSKEVFLDEKALREGFLILDFGSQYTWLIARSFRELGFYSHVEIFDFSLAKIKQLNPAGIILSGGPASVFDKDSLTRDLKELYKIAPIMGICYGLQLICHQWGGKIASSDRRTYGSGNIYWKKNIITNTQSQKVWMSHGDFVSKIPKNFSILAETERKIPAVLESENILALQFHPEVSHTEKGQEFLSYFAEKICGLKNKSWTAQSMLNLLESQIKSQVKSSDHLLCALSGGVDSTVMAVLLTKVLGPEHIHCVFVDTGLLRLNEFQQVLSALKKIGLNVEGVPAGSKFLSALKGVEDPEKKRKIIGGLFIDIFKEYGGEKNKIKYLAQGTLYPDVIESVSFKGPSVTIKSHHNVGGLPKDMPFKLIEPLRLLFKDEVRKLGEILKIPKDLLYRHPFPGPGLAVRICGKITAERIRKVAESDAIFIEELKKAGYYEKIWQAFTVLLPVQSVGVQGDNRTYDEVIVLRSITSTDGMTADWYDFPSDFLKKVSNLITNKVKGVNRVVYDITSKPPGTIEWL